MSRVAWLNDRCNEYGILDVVVVVWDGGSEAKRLFDICGFVGAAVGDVS